MKIKTKIFFLINILLLISNMNTYIYAQNTDSYYSESYESYPEEGYSEEVYTEEIYPDEEIEELIEELDEVSVEDIDDTSTLSLFDSTNKIEVSVPILQLYKGPFHIDADKPNLPPTHQLTKLRGTVWRGSKKYIISNSAGAVACKRMYIYFDKDRDAIAYKYESYKSFRVPNMPSFDAFIPLIPLLKTNTFTPIKSDTLSELSNILKKENKYSNITPIFDVVAPIVTNVESKKDIEIINEQNEQIDIEIIDEEDEQIEESNDATNITEEEIYEEEYLEEYPIDESYEYDITAGLKKLPITMVAQEIAINENNQYIINIGGNTSGIFVHKTKNSREPYTVIFLSMESGMTLYEHHIKNSFDVRDSWSEASKKAREIYIKILNEKIDMQQFKKISFFNDLLED